MRNFLNNSIKLAAGLLIGFLSITYAYSQCATYTVTINNVSCPGGSDGSVIITFKNTSGTDYSYTLFGQNNGFNPKDTTTYSYTYKNLVADTVLIVGQKKGTSACTETVIITEPNPITIPGVVSNALCFGTKTGSITKINPSGGTSPYSYSWSNGASTENLANIAAGTYTVTITDKNGCQQSQAFTVTQPNLVALSVSPSSTICLGQSATLTATGSSGDTYSWSNGASGSSISVSPTTTTTYTVTADSSGCTSNPANVIVTVITATITAATSTTFCTGGNVVLNANTTGSGLTYQWYNGTAISGATASSYTATVSGSYTVRVSNGSCSVTSAPIAVTVNSLPIVTASASPTAICAGNSSTLTASASGNGALSYAWSNGTSGVSTSVSPAATTSYTVTVKDANGCSATSTPVAVTVNSLPTVSASASPSIICQGSSSTLTASASGNGTLTYAWSNGASGVSTSVSPAATTSYSVTVKDANGCSATSIPVTVTVNSLPTVSASASPSVICGGNSSTLTASASGNGGLTYAWSDGASGASTSVSPAATTSYTVTVKDANGCSATSTPVAVTVNSLPIVSASASPAVICSGNSTTLTATASGNGTLTYAWSNGASGVSTSVSPAASTSYTVTVKDGNGCSATSASVAVTVNPTPSTPTISAGGPTTFCSGSSVTLSANPSSGYSYQWDNGGVIIAGATNPTYIATTSGIYTVTISNAGCSSSSSTAITVNATPATPTITAGGATTFCSGGSVTLTGNSTTSGVTYQWDLAGSPISGATNAAYTASASGNYTVTAFTGACSATSTSTPVTVNPNPPNPTIAAGGPTTFCSGSSVTLSATPASGYSFQWDNGGAMIAGATNATYIATTSGTYTVTLSTGTCSTSSATAVTVIATPATPTTSTSGATTFCTGGSVTLTGNSTTSGVTYQWDLGGSPIAGATNAAYIASASGSYTITAFTGACSATSSPVAVTVNSLPTVSASASPAIVCAGSSSTLTASASGNGTLTYTWSNAASGVSTSVSPTVNTSYTVTVKDANGCSATSAPVAVTVNTLPIVSASASPAIICAGSPSTLTASATGNGTLTYLWSNAATGASTSVSPAASTSYTVTVKDANGCSVTSAPVAVTVNTLPIVSASASPAIICAGGSTTLTASATGNGALTYAWSDGASGVSTSVSPAASTSYTVTVKDANGCSVTSAPVAVTVNTLPTVSASASPVAICAGSSSTLTASATGNGTLTYAWSNGATGISTSVSPTVNTSYTVTVKDANGCSVTSTPVAVTANSLPTVSASASPAAICAGSSSTLTASATGNGALTYVWSNGASGVSTSVSPTVNTSYTVIVKDANGCSATSAPVAITVDGPTITASATPAIICEGSSSTLTASATGNGTLTYTWSNAATGVSTSVSPATSTSYTVTVKDANGCTVTSAPVSVTVNSLPIVSASTSPAAICAGSSSTLTASATGNGTLTYTWSDGASGVSTSVSPTVNSSYTVTVKDANGCSAISAPVSVTLNSLPTVSASASPAIICAGSPSTLTASATGNGALTYTWSNAATGVSTSVSPAVSTSYTVTVKDANGCSATSAPVSVTVNSLPTVSASASPAIICAGGSTTLTASATGNGTLTYTWSNAATGASTSVSPAANTSYTVTVNDANGCSVTSAPVAVTVNSLPIVSASASPAVICSGSSTTLTATASGNGSLTYAWSNGTSGVSTSVSPATSTSYTVTVKDANGCSVTSTPIAVTVNSLPIVSASASPAALCAGSSSTLTASATGNGTLTYAWSNGASGLSTSVSPATSTSYTVTVNDANGCSATSAAVAITVDGPTVTASASSPVICAGSSTTLNASASGSGTLTYSWSNGASGASTPVSPTSSISYTVTVSDANGCSVTSAPVAVTVNSLPTVSASVSSPVICAGIPDTLTMNAAGNGPFTYSWSPAAGLINASIQSPVANITSSATYTATVQDVNGCIAAPSPVSITVNSLPSITASSTKSSICTGGFTTLNASVTGNGPFNYSWSPAASLSNATIQSPLASPTSLTSYTVIATDVNNCQNTSAPITITIDGGPIVNPTAIKDSICIGTSTTLEANASGDSPFIYSWSPAASLNDSTLQNPTSNIIATTTYTLIVKDSNGCVSSPNTVTVVVNSLPSVTIAPPSNICNGSAATLATIPTGTGPFTYNWSPSASLDSATSANPLANPTDTTAYTVTITDKNGCQNTASATVNVWQKPTGTLAPSDSTVCKGMPVTLIANFGSAFTPADSGYSFNGGKFQTSNSYTISPIDSNAAVTVILKDKNNCISAGIIDTVFAEAVKATVLSTAASCYDLNNGSVTINIPNGNSGFKFSIDGGGLQTSNTFNNLKTGTHTVIATDTVRGCSFDSTITINQPDSLIIAVKSIQEVNPCSGSNDGEIDATVTGGTPHYNFSINNGTTWQADSAFKNLAAGSYALLVKDSLGCTASVDTSVTAPNGVNISNIKILSQTNNICAGKTDGAITLDTSTISGGAKPYSYILDNDTVSYPSFSNLAGVTDTVNIKDTIQIKDANGCTYNYLFAIYSPAAIKFATVATPATCNHSDGMIQILTTGITGGTPPYLYELDSFSTKFDTISTFTGLSLGNYHVTVQDANSCTAGEPVIIGPKPGPIPYITVDSTRCYNSKDGSITIDSLQGGISPFQYELINYSGLTSIPSFTGLKADTSKPSYELAIQDGSTCTYNIIYYYKWNAAKNAYDTLHSSSIPIAQPNRIDASVATQSTSQHLSLDMIEVSGITGGTPGYQIIFDSTTYAYNASTPTTFTGLGKGSSYVYIKDSHGCIDSMKVVSAFFIPNIITPNGDSKNDYFEVVSIPINSDLKIFDRWGGKLYENSNYDNSWNGDGLSDGVYYYELAVHNGSTYKGWVEIVR